jgi:hypothetical protein
MTTLFEINDNVWFIRRSIEGDDDEEEEAEEGDA